jgi:GT2 family glycosyltransferase
VTAVIVAVPTIVRHDLLRRLLESCDRGSLRPDGYLVIDNGDMAFECAGVRVHRPVKNLGVAGSWNYALRAYPEANVVLVNDDVIMPRVAVEQMVEAALEHRVPTHVRLGDFTVHMHTPGIVDIVGWYDERFWPAYYEDLDYFYRLARAGVRMVNLPIEVPGDRNGTWSRAPRRLGRQLEKGHRRNARYYRRKWGGNPGHERYLCPFDGKTPP